MKMSAIFSIIDVIFEEHLQIEKKKKETTIKNSNLRYFKSEAIWKKCRRIEFVLVHPTPKSHTTLTQRFSMIPNWFKYDR